MDLKCFCESNFFMNSKGIHELFTNLQKFHAFVKTEKPQKKNEKIENRKRKRKKGNWEVGRIEQTTKPAVYRIART